MTVASRGLLQGLVYALCQSTCPTFCPGQRPRKSLCCDAICHHHAQSPSFKSPILPCFLGVNLCVRLQTFVDTSPLVDVRHFQLLRIQVYVPFTIGDEALVAAILTDELTYLCALPYIGNHRPRRQNGKNNVRTSRFEYTLCTVLAADSHFGKNFIISI